VNEITRLKLAVTKANMNSNLPNGYTLNEAIIELANIRSAIDQLQDLLQIGKGRFLFSERRRNTTEIKTIKQTAPDKILKMIEEYDTKRRLFDAIIQEANHTTEINWPQKE
jgi:hypothetical protein